jgi:predicted DsbA family dithiol-disulfide isomerase
LIEVFADVACPFTHVGLIRLFERRDQVGSNEVVHVKAWPLELVNGEPLDPALVDREITELRRHVAPELFGKFDDSHLPMTTLPALILTTAAYAVGMRVGERVSLAIRHALFEDGLDVSAPDVLAEIAATHAVRGDLADEADVVAEWREGQRRGVEGSPYFFAKGEGFFCPSLDIQHVDGDLRVQYDDAELARFLGVAFG